MKTSEQLNRETDPERIRRGGMIRRMIVSIAKGAIWQLAGVRMPDGTETRKAEVFGGIGFYARPPANGKPEVITANVGDASTPIVIALRDEKTRAAVCAALGLDETAMFNSMALVLCKNDGTIEARSVGGTAHALALQSDLVALRDHVNALLTGGSGSAVVPAPSAGTGTTVFKAE